MSKVWVLQDAEEGIVYGVYSSEEEAERQMDNLGPAEPELSSFELDKGVEQVFGASWSLEKCKATGRTKERYNGVIKDAPGMFSIPPVGYNICSFDQGTPWTWAYGGTEEQAKKNARVWFDMVLAAMKEGTKPDEGSFKGEF